MTNIVVNRVLSLRESTLSIVTYNGEHVGFGLEDEYRDEKVAGKTRIDNGVYHIGVRVHGGYNDKYTKKFSGFHQGMLEVEGVPNFTNILIHVGNYHYDTAGCLLIGARCGVGDQNAVLYKSRDGYMRFYKKVIDHALRGDLWIEYNTKHEIIKSLVKQGSR